MLFLLEIVTAAPPKQMQLTQLGVFSGTISWHNHFVGTWGKQVVIGGDGQVSLGHTIMKGNGTGCTTMTRLLPGLQVAGGCFYPI